MTLSYFVPILFASAILLFLFSRWMRRRSFDRWLKEVRPRPCKLLSTKELAYACDYRPKWIYDADYDLPSKGIDFDSREVIRPGSLVYLGAIDLPDFQKKMLGRVAGRVVLVVHGCDEGPVKGWMSHWKRNHRSYNRKADAENMLARLLDDDRVAAMYSVNVDFVHPKLHAIPLGIDYHSLAQPLFSLRVCGNAAVDYMGPPMSPVQQEQQLFEIASVSRHFSLRPATAYTTGTWNNTAYLRSDDLRLDRIQLFEAVKNMGSIVTAERRVPRRKSWENQTKHAFVLSPIGNGLDCYRTYEALALGCAVITKRSSLGDSDLFDELPVIMIDHWEEVTEESLRRWHQELTEEYHKGTFNMNKLSLCYWIQKMKAELN